MDFARADRATLQRMLESGMFGAAGERRIRDRLQELDQAAAAPSPVPTREAQSKKPGKRRGEMNQTEARFAAEVLEPMQLRGEILGYEYEPMTFRLPDVGRYTPDFVVRLPTGGLRCYETKGRQVWEKDKLRYRIAARERPWIWWTMMQWDGKLWRVIYDNQPRDQ